MKTPGVQILLLLAFSFPVILNAQNSSNNVVVSSNASNASISTESMLENVLVGYNTITVRTESTKAYRLYVRVSNMTNTSGTPMPASMAAIQLSGSDASSRCTPVTAKITLSQSNQLLVTDTDRTDSNGDYFYYNTFFGPIGYNYAPGNYTFTLLFTMTQP